MPAASGAHIKYAWKDHDPAYLNQAPPVKDTWYTVAHVYDFRELLFAVKYDDDEHNLPAWEVKWTIDGNVYLFSGAGEDNAQLYISKNKYPSTGGTLGLYPRSNYVTLSNYDDKRGQDGLFQVRVTNVVGTNPVLEAWLLYEELEET